MRLLYLCSYIYNYIMYIYIYTPNNVATHFGLALEPKCNKSAKHLALTTASSHRAAPHTVGIESDDGPGPRATHV